MAQKGLKRHFAVILPSPGHLLLSETLCHQSPFLHYKHSVLFEEKLPKLRQVHQRKFISQSKGTLPLLEIRVQLETVTIRGSHGHLRVHDQGKETYQVR